jgi:hypothetical protein
VTGDGDAATRRFVERLDATVVATRGLVSHLERLIATLDDARARLQKTPIDEVVLEMVATGAPDIRRDVYSALRDFESSLQVLRGAGIRVLVDGERMTITEVARLIAVSVQMARRLYRAAERESEDPWVTRPGDG